MDDGVNELITEFVDQTGRRPQEWNPSWEANWNIAPTQDIPVLLDSTREPGCLRFENASWSLVPRWSETLRMKYPTFNARAETAAEKPTFAAAVRSTRAVIFAEAYYEWRTENGVKVPHVVRPADGSTMAFAGLYSWWADPTLPGDAPERWHLTATILTAPALGHMEPLHARTPVLIPREDWPGWIDVSTRGDHALVEHAVSRSAALTEALDYYPVAPVRGNGPELLRPLDAA